MTSPPSPPNRRRRWIVVGIAVLVLGMGWWLWPARIDPRFVGRWLHSVGSRNRPLEWTFKDDGTMEGEWQIYPVQRWTVEGNHLTLSPTLHSRNIAAFLFGLKPYALPTPFSYRIVSVSENQFDLEAGATVLHFERMAESP